MVSLFEVAYGFVPLTLLDMLPLLLGMIEDQNGVTKSKFVKVLHARVRESIEKKTKHYKCKADRGRRMLFLQLGY